MTYGKKERADFTWGRETTEKEDKIVAFVPEADGDHHIPSDMLSPKAMRSTLPDRGNHPEGYQKVGLKRLFLLFLDGKEGPISLCLLFWCCWLTWVISGGAESRGEEPILTFAFSTFCAAPCHRCPGILWQRDYFQSLTGWSEGSRERERESSVFTWLLQDYLGTQLIISVMETQPLATQRSKLSQSHQRDPPCHSKGGFEKCPRLYLKGEENLVSVCPLIRVLLCIIPAGVAFFFFS